MSIVPKYNILPREDIKTDRLDRIAMTILFNKLNSIKYGFLQVQFNGVLYDFGPKQMRNILYAKIDIHDRRTFKTILLEGEPAAGNTYVHGWWSTEDLIQVLRLFTINREALFSFKYGLASAMKAYSYINKSLKRNNLQGAKRNISAHYDIGNEMYRLFLDGKMMYSSAYYTDEHDDLESASEKKLDLICTKLKLSAQDKVIEIGSGWGGFAVHAAENYGCHVTTTTISEEQYQHVVALVKAKGLENRVLVLKNDYRNLEGKYDKLVSIEMIESVGHQYINDYFSICSHLLKDNGIMLIQAITISDYLYKQYINSMDFIRKYVFPGGCLTSISSMLDSSSSHTDLTLFHSESFASSYAKTLSHWYKNFNGNRKKVIEQGYPGSFIRLWEYYLKYCQAGFEERVIDVHQLVFKKPGNRLESIY